MSADVPRLLDALGIEYREHGDELWAPCPNPDHHETRPSWSMVSAPHDPRNGTHYCFGCQFAGGPIDLTAKVIGVTYGRAKQWITEKGLWLKGSLPLAVKFEVHNMWASGLRLPSGLISGPLDNWASPVRRYAIRRGLTDHQVQRWEICYAIDGAMGGRIVFPVKDSDTKWHSWHARTYCNQDKRYKNASEKDGFDPGAIFGMRWWPEHEARASAVLVLTEGALDALACERAGARYIAAIGGSDPHARQLLKLSAWGAILVATDGDKAGNKVYTTLRHQIGAKVSVRRVEIPDGFDAARLGKLNPELLKELLWRAESVVDVRRKPGPSRGSRRRLVRSPTRTRESG